MCELNQSSWLVFPVIGQIAFPTSMPYPAAETISFGRQHLAAFIPPNFELIAVGILGAAAAARDFRFARQGGLSGTRLPRSQKETDPLAPLNPNHKVRAASECKQKCGPITSFPR